MKTIQRIISGKSYKVESGLVDTIRKADNGLRDYSDTYVQVNLDKSTNEIWGDFHCSIGHNSWKQYDDSNIVTLGNYSNSKFTLSELAFAIAEH